MVLPGSTHARPKTIKLDNVLLDSYRVAREVYLSSSQTIDQCITMIDQLNLRIKASETVRDGIPSEGQSTNPLYNYHVNALKKLAIELDEQKTIIKSETKKQKDAQARIPVTRKALQSVLETAQKENGSYGVLLSQWKGPFDDNQVKIDKEEAVVDGNRKNYEKIQQNKEQLDQDLLLETTKQSSNKRQRLYAEEQKGAIDRDIKEYQETIAAKTAELNSLQADYAAGMEEYGVKQEEQAANSKDVLDLQRQVKVTDDEYQAKQAEKTALQQSGEWAALPEEDQTAINKVIDDLTLALDRFKKKLTELEAEGADITNELVKLKVIVDQYPPQISEVQDTLSANQGKLSQAKKANQEIAVQLASLTKTLDKNNAEIAKLNEEQLKLVAELEKVAGDFVVLKAKFEASLQIQEEARVTLNSYTDQQRENELKTELFSNAYTSINSLADGFEKVGEDMNEIYSRTHASKGIIKVSQIMLEAYEDISYSRNDFFKHSGMAHSSRWQYDYNTNYRYTGKVDADVIAMLQDRDAISEYVALRPSTVTLTPTLDSRTGKMVYNPHNHNYKTSEGWYRAAQHVTTSERIKLIKGGTPRDQIAALNQWGQKQWEGWRSGVGWSWTADAELIAIVGPTGIIGKDVVGSVFRGNWDQSFPHRADFGTDKSGAKWSWWGKDSYDPYRPTKGNDDGWEITFGIFDTDPQATAAAQRKANNILGKNGMSFLATAMPNIEKDAVRASVNEAKKAIGEIMSKHPVYKKSWAISPRFRTTVKKAVEAYYKLRLNQSRASKKAFIITRYAASMIAYDGDKEQSLKTINDMREAFEHFHENAQEFWQGWADERDHALDMMNQIKSDHLGLSGEEYDKAKELYIKQMDNYCKIYGKNIIAEGLAVQEAEADKIYAMVQTIFFQLMAENANNEEEELQFKQLEAEKNRQIARMLKAKEQLSKNRTQIESRIKALQEDFDKATADEKTKAKFNLEFAQDRLAWFVNVEKAMGDAEEKIEKAFERNVAAAHRQTREVYNALKKIGRVVEGETNKRVRESLINKAVVAARKNMEAEEEQSRTIEKWAAELANSLTMIIINIENEQKAVREGTLGESARKLIAYESAADLGKAVGANPTLSAVYSAKMRSSTNVLEELYRFSSNNSVAEVAAQAPQGGSLDTFLLNDDGTTQQTIFSMVDLVLAIEEEKGEAGGLYKKADARFKLLKGNGEVETLAEMSFEKIEDMAETHRKQLESVKQEANKKIEDAKIRLIKEHNENTLAVKNFTAAELARETHRNKELKAYHTSLKAQEEIQRKRGVTKLAGEFGAKRKMIEEKLHESVGEYQLKWLEYFADQKLYNKTINKKLHEIKLKILKQKQDGKVVHDEVLAAFDAKELQVANRFDEQQTVSAKDLYTKQRVNIIFTALAKVTATIDAEADINKAIVDNLKQIVAEQQRQTVALEAKRNAQFKSYTEQIITKLDEEIGETVTNDDSELQVAIVAIANDHHARVNAVQVESHNAKITLIKEQSALRIKQMSDMKTQVFAEINNIQDQVMGFASMGFEEVLEINSLVKSNYAISRMEAEKSYKLSASLQVSNTFAQVYGLQKQETFNRIKTAIDWQAEEPRYRSEFLSRLNYAVSAPGVGDGSDDLVGDNTDEEIRNINQAAYANAVGYSGFKQGVTAVVTSGDNWKGQFVGGTAPYTETMYPYDAEELADTVSIYEKIMQSYLSGEDKKEA